MKTNNKLERSDFSEWISTDKQLSDTLVEIQQMPFSAKEQAAIAFDRISDMYHVPKNPDDLARLEKANENQDDEDAPERTCVYEQLGYLKYLGPDDDIRGLVIAAIFLVKNGYNADLYEVVKKKFGKRKLPANIGGIGLIGSGIDVEVVFVENGQSWYHLGCRMFVKF